jgi:hypothetical protein
MAKNSPHCWYMRQTIAYKLLLERACYSLFVNLNFAQILP